MEASGGVYTAYEKKILADGSYLITPTYKRNYQNLGSQYVISFLRQINDINNLTRRLGLLRIDINKEAINRLYKNIKLGDTGCIFLVNRDGYIASHSQKEKINADETMELKFNGLDTFATVFLNGEQLGTHANMFTPAVFAVTKKVKPGFNQLLVRFDPVVAYTNIQDYSRMWYSYNRNRVWVRKCQMNFRCGVQG